MWPNIFDCSRLFHFWNVPWIHSLYSYYIPFNFWPSSTLSKPLQWFPVCSFKASDSSCILPAYQEYLFNHMFLLLRKLWWLPVIWVKCQLVSIPHKTMLILYSLLFSLACVLAILVFCLFLEYSMDFNLKILYISALSPLLCLRNSAHLFKFHLDVSFENYLLDTPFFLHTPL